MLISCETWIFTDKFLCEDSPDAFAKCTTVPWCGKGFPITVLLLKCKYGSKQTDFHIPFVKRAGDAAGLREGSPLKRMQ